MLIKWRPGVFGRTSSTLRLSITDSTKRTAVTNTPRRGIQRSTARNNPEAIDVVRDMRFAVLPEGRLVTKALATKTAK